MPEKPSTKWIAAAVSPLDGHCCYFLIDFYPILAQEVTTRKMPLVNFKFQKAQLSTQA
jgi:hypothetical protein